MTGRVDVVELALDIDACAGLLETCERQRLAMARVVIAAAERVKSGHDGSCYERAPRHGNACTCGHDALVAALKGEGKS